MNTVSFNNLPGVTPLFRDYVYHPEKLQDFFEHDWRDGSARLTQLQTRVIDRTKLTDILSRQATRWGAPAAVSANIELLQKPSTFAVVTGQQMGIFGGPLYTLYKALATVLYCREFKRRYPQADFVPVFWMELEDHDFEEVRKTTVLAQTGELTPISIESAADHPDRKPIYTLFPPSDIAQLIDKTAEVLGQTDFTATWTEALKEAYRPDRSFSDAFAIWTMALLGETGLVLMDPSDPELKEMARPVFEREIDQAEAIHADVVETSAALRKAGYHAQVETAGSNLFLLMDPPISVPFSHEPTAKLRLDLSTVKTHRDFLKTVLADEPHRFIPNVVLRPIVQDTLLPTFAYIGGPSEVAYFAQFRNLYRRFDLQSPLILARPFATLIEKKIGKILNKFAFDFERMVNHSKTLINELTLQDSVLPMLFEKWKLQSSQGVRDVQEELVKIDPSLKGASETALQRMTHAIEVLENKATEAQKRQADVSVRQIQKALDHLYPHDQFQERGLNVVYFLNKYGFDFVGTMERALRLDTCDHQLIEL